MFSHNRTALFSIIANYGIINLIGSNYYNNSALSILNVKSFSGSLFLQSIEFSQNEISFYYVSFEAGFNVTISNVSVLFSNNQNPIVFGGGAFYFAYVINKNFINVTIKNILSSKSVFGIKIEGNLDSSNNILKNVKTKNYN